MDMWCPYSIGREIWDREVLKIVDPDPIPLKRGDLPSGCASLRECRRFGPHRIIVVVVAVAVAAAAVVVSLLPCNFSSTRLGGMRGAIV